MPKKIATTNETKEQIKKIESLSNENEDLKNQLNEMSENHQKPLHN